MIHIGIDPSLNSTGICILNDKTGSVEYYIITNKITKKAEKFNNCPFIKLVQYDKIVINKSDDYENQEIQKTINLRNIVNEIKNIIEKYHDPKKIFMEGISYGSTSTSALMELAGLNYLIRNMLEDLSIPYKVITPSANKKFAVGIGNADKDIMVNAWIHCQPQNIKNSILIKQNLIKMDDIADAYFLASHE